MYRVDGSQRRKVCTMQGGVAIVRGAFKSATSNDSLSSARTKARPVSLCDVSRNGGEVDNIGEWLGTSVTFSPVFQLQQQISIAGGGNN